MVMIQMMINIPDGRDDADLHIRMVQMIHTKKKITIDTLNVLKVML